MCFYALFSRLTHYCFFFHSSFGEDKSVARCVYLSSEGAAGASCAADHHGLVGPFSHVTFLPDAQQSSESCQANCTQKVGQVSICQLGVNLQQPGFDLIIFLANTYQDTWKCSYLDILYLL